MSLKNAIRDQGCTPRPALAPSPKIFKTARPRPTLRCPEFNCYPAPRILLTALPRPIPKQKKAALCIPVRDGGSTEPYTAYTVYTVKTICTVTLLYCLKCFTLHNVYFVKYIFPRN